MVEHIKRALIIEDEDHIRRLIEFIFAKEKVETVGVESGEEGLSILMQDTAFDLILLDIYLKGMSGLQVLQQIRQDPVIRQIPIVLLTSLADQKMVSKSIELGAKDFICKPFHPRDLWPRIEKKLADLKSKSLQCF